MRRKMTAVAASLTLLVAASCGGDDDDSTGDADDESPATTMADADDESPATTMADADDSGETFEIKYPHVWGGGQFEDNVCGQGFADTVEEQSGGRITFEVTPGGALGGEIELEENVFEGVFQMTGLTNVGWGVHDPRASVMGLPFIFEDTADVMTFLESDLHQELADDLLSDRGARVLAPCISAYREIVAKKPLLVPADFEGLKIRVPELPTWVQTLEALGAEPTPLPFPEAYEALSTGLVDGVDITFSAGVDLGFDEIAKEFSSTRHLWSGAWIIINEDFFQSLPADLQQVLTDAADAVYADYEANAQEYMDRGYRLVEESDANGHVDDVDRAALAAATADTQVSLAEQLDIVDEYERTLAILGG